MMFRRKSSCRFDFAAEPIGGIVAAFERRWGEQDEEVGAGADVFDDDALEVAAGYAVVVEEDVVAVMGQVLEDRAREPWVGSAVGDEDGLLDASHVLPVIST